MMVEGAQIDLKAVAEEEALQIGLAVVGAGDSGVEILGQVAVSVQAEVVDTGEGAETTEDFVHEEMILEEVVVQVMAAQVVAALVVAAAHEIAALAEAVAVLAAAAAELVADDSVRAHLVHVSKFCNFNKANKKRVHLPLIANLFSFYAKTKQTFPHPPPHIFV